MLEEVQRHSVHTLLFRSLKRTHDMFLSSQGTLPPVDELAEKVKRGIKAHDSYSLVLDKVKQSKVVRNVHLEAKQDRSFDTDGIVEVHEQTESAVVPYTSGGTVAVQQNTSVTSIIPRKAPAMPRPKWHAPWKLYRVISGHLGWVRCVTVEPGNEWFATGSADRVIKVWELATGKLKVSLTGHISSVRGLAVSPRHPYLFSCGEDRQVKCWDLEYNKVIRHYHGHLSAVYSLSLHPTIDVLITAGRDATARVWDMRTKANVHTLSGHTNTIASVISQAAEPQGVISAENKVEAVMNFRVLENADGLESFIGLITFVGHYIPHLGTISEPLWYLLRVITGSHDCTIRLWDLAGGKSIATLTNHKKSIRAVTFHPTLYMFASASPDNIKQWKCPEGVFIQNLSGHNAIVNCLAINPEGVLVSGADNGTLHCWDWRTGYNFQRLQAPVQPGSMDSESGIFSMTFDQSGSRLITTEADKTIKIYKEDDTATEESHPIHWRPEILKRRKY